METPLNSSKQGSFQQQGINENKHRNSYTAADIVTVDNQQFTFENVNVDSPSPVVQPGMIEHEQPNRKPSFRHSDDSLQTQRFGKESFVTVRCWERWIDPYTGIGTDPNRPNKGEKFDCDLNLYQMMVSVGLTSS